MMSRCAGTSWSVADGDGAWGTLLLHAGSPLRPQDWALVEALGADFDEVGGGRRLFDVTELRDEHIGFEKTAVTWRDPAGVDDGVEA